MEKNMSKVDRIIRLTTASLLLIIGFLLIPQENYLIGSILLVIAGLLGITGLCSRCPLYKITGYSTITKTLKAEKSTQITPSKK